MKSMLHDCTRNNPDYPKADFREVDLAQQCGYDETLLVEVWNYSWEPILLPSPDYQREGRADE